MAISFAFRVSAATLICVASVLCLLWLYNFRAADLEHVGELFGRLIGADDVEDGSTGKGEFINYYMVVFAWFFTFLLGDGVNGRGGRVPSVLMEKAEKVAVEEFEWAGEFCLGFQSGRLIYG